LTEKEAKVLFKKEKKTIKEAISLKKYYAEDENTNKISINELN